MARRVIDLRPGAPTDAGECAAAKRRRRRADVRPRGLRPPASASSSARSTRRSPGAGAAGDYEVGAWLRGAGEEILGFTPTSAGPSCRAVSGAAFVRLRMIGTAEAVDEFGYDPRLRGASQRAHPACSTSSGGASRRRARPRAASRPSCCWSATTPGGLFPYDGVMIAEALRAHHPGGGRHARPLVEDFVYQHAVPRAGAGAGRHRPRVVARTPAGCSRASRP